MGSSRISKNRSLSSYLKSLDQSAISTGIKVDSYDSGMASSVIGESALAEQLEIFDKSIQSGNYVEGQSGWKITGAGNAEFGNVFVRGDINAWSGSIGYWNISTPAVTRVFGTESLLGTFLESSASGSNDLDLKTGTYVGLFKSYNPTPVVVTYRERTSNIATLTLENHDFVVGDKVSISLESTNTLTPWTGLTSGFSTSGVFAVHWGNNIWAIAGQSGKLSTSTDGTTWTARTSTFGANSIFKLKYGSGLWAAVGGAGSLASSTDALTWVSKTSGTASNLYAVEYSNGLWVIGGDSGFISTSPDLSTWTSRTSNFGTDSIRAIRYGNGLWVAVGTNGKLSTSTDGTTWTARTSTFGTTPIYGVHYDNGLWVAVGASNKIATSTNGTTWTAVTTIYSTYNYSSVHYANGIWVAVGSVTSTGADCIVASFDGAIWQSMSGGSANTGLSDVFYSAGVWISGGPFGNLISSTDPIVFNTYSGYSTVTSVSLNTISFSSTGIDISSTSSTGYATLVNPDVAGLYLRDYGKTLFDYGYFSNKGIAYNSPYNVNLVKNPSFEYIPSESGQTNSPSNLVASTNSWSFPAEQVSPVNYGDYPTYNTFNQSVMGGLFMGLYIWNTASNNYLSATIDGNAANYFRLLNTEYDRNLYLNFDLSLIGVTLGSSGLGTAAATGNGTSITYTKTSHGLVKGMVITTTGYAPSGFNIKNAVITSTTSNTITVSTSGVSGTSTTTGTITVVPLSYGMDLSEVRFRFSNGSTIELYSVLTSSSAATWSEGSSWLYVDDIGLDDSFKKAISSIPVISSKKLANYYKNLDPSGYSINSDFYLDIPGWLWRQPQGNAIVSSTGGSGVATHTLANPNFYTVGTSVVISGSSGPGFNGTRVITAVTSTTFSVADSTVGSAINGNSQPTTYVNIKTNKIARGTDYLTGVGYLIDSVQLSTTQQFFFANTPFSGSTYWLSASNTPVLDIAQPSYASIQDTTKWLNLNLDAQTFEINQVDYLGFEYKASKIFYENPNIQSWGNQSDASSRYIDSITNINSFRIHGGSKYYETSDAAIYGFLAADTEYLVADERSAVYSRSSFVPYTGTGGGSGSITKGYAETLNTTENSTGASRSYIGAETSDSGTIVNKAYIDLNTSEIANDSTVDVAAFTVNITGITTITGNTTISSGTLTTGTIYSGTIYGTRFDSTGGNGTSAGTADVMVLTGAGNSTGTSKGIESRTTSTSTRYHVSFTNPNGQVGTITTSASSTAYNTNSDYRLKENDQPMVDSIDKIMMLRPITFNFKADPGHIVDGFFAHEVQEIIPWAVAGYKDAVNDFGDPDYQGIDQSKIVPLLTAALQDAVKEINSLKNRIEILEGR